jgi:hypothetical protein
MPTSSGVPGVRVGPPSPPTLWAWASSPEEEKTNPAARGKRTERRKKCIRRPGVGIDNFVMRWLLWEKRTRNQNRRPFGK